VAGWAIKTIPEGRFTPAISLTILLLTGVVALIAVLVIAVAVFAALGLSNKTHAFGMPEGTIRAVIALGLVLIFSITSVFLYWQLRSQPTERLSGLTQEQLGQIPAEEIMSSTPISDDPVLYDVRIRLEQNEASEDFAKQMLTVISTLVVAVAAFYFGTRAVSVARGAAAPSQPIIRSLEPKEAYPGDEKDITILGRNFESPKTVKLIGEKRDMTFQDILTSTTEIKCRLVVPSTQDIGPYTLLVVNSDGSEDRLEKAFEVKKKP